MIQEQRQVFFLLLLFLSSYLVTQMQPLEKELI